LDYELRIEPTTKNPDVYNLFALSPASLKMQHFAEEFSVHSYRDFELRP